MTLKAIYILLDSTVVTYTEFRYNEDYTTNKFHRVEKIKHPLQPSGDI